jgi:hypothetical protein
MMDDGMIGVVEGDTTSLEQQVEVRLLTAAENHGGGWVTLVFHQIGEPGSVYSTRDADMTALLDWLQARAERGTVVKTVREVIGGSVQPRPS